ncbi:small integral membrane protein 20-like [Cervus elaphus]|uniref:small integral membrane protein 20-like n=1 Tax=Cervus canadensis TaxID=1574408 RepID=UPI001C9E6C67|nr:small integral membrane protein 20-like [Cervus canadensis]XP_043739973.1 small integral membrane protein 20-like [Cervus elaphus]
MTNTVKKPDPGPAGGSWVWRVPGTRRIRVAPAGARSGNLRTALVFRGFISLRGAACYPIYFQALMWLEEYKKEEAMNRAGIVQEDVRPPGLKAWSDPFGRK